jgi:hypothetical protein
VYPRFLNVSFLQLWALRRCFSLEDLEWEVLARKVLAVEKSWRSQNRQLGSKKQPEGTTGKRSKKSSKASGLEGSGAPWCAAYVVWVGDSALGRDRNPTQEVRGRLISSKNRTGIEGVVDYPPKQIPSGSIFKVLKEWGTRGLIEKVSGDFAITIEGNTNNGGSRDGDGVYRRRRLLDSLLAKDWL